MDRLMSEIGPNPNPHVEPDPRKYFGSDWDDKSDPGENIELDVNKAEKPQTGASRTDASKETTLPKKESVKSVSGEVARNLLIETFKFSPDEAGYSSANSLKNVWPELNSRDKQVISNMIALGKKGKMTRESAASVLKHVFSTVINREQGRIPIGEAA